MRDRIPQSDWKHFKAVRERALQRLCERALSSLVDIASDTSMTAHERYLDVYSKIHEYDDQIATGFNELSRSRMLHQIVYAKSLGLIHDDEIEGFTQETQDDIDTFVVY